MRIVSIVFSLLLAITPAIVSAQDQSNDSLVENGVFLPELLRSNPNASIFYNALQATHLSDTLQKYLDASYPGVSYDSTLMCLMATGQTAILYRTAYETEKGIFPEQRLFKYTVFVVSDSVLNNVYGIRSLDDLVAKAKDVYSDPAHINDSHWLNTSPLFKLMSYHILPCGLTYDQFNVSDQKIIDRRSFLDELDVEDFYETLMPHSLIRISSAYDVARYAIVKNNRIGIFINRKGTESAGNLEYKGIRIWTDPEYGQYSNNAINGCYHFVDSLLLYNNATKDALNTRIRVMFSTISPDFINSGARGRLRTYEQDRYVVGFKKGYCKNVDWTIDTEFYVRYRDAAFGCLYGDELTLRGTYDITFRLPPVPNSGLYEIRIPLNSLMSSSVAENRGSVLYYTRKENNDYIPCGIPVGMNFISEDPSIGYVRDRNFIDRYPMIEAQDSILANDKAMRMRGYMKSPDIYYDMRDNSNFLRRIVCEQYMEEGKDYYLRIRQVGDRFETLPLNYLELVPYSIYSGENGLEDKH